jgi:predicted nucleotidyltransferase
MRTQGLRMSEVLFGQIRSGILALLYGHPDQSFYLRQIARHIEASAGAVQRDITQLSKAGLINRTPVGSQVFYQANSNSPIFAEMRGLVTKTVGVHDTLLFLLAPHAKKIKVAFVYGSVARHEETAQSDVDLIVIGNIGLEELMPTLGKTQSLLGREVNATVYSTKEFRSKVDSGNHFLQRVLKDEKLFLIGSVDELRKVGGVRMAQAANHQSR